MRGALEAGHLKMPTTEKLDDQAEAASVKDGKNAEEAEADAMEHLYSLAQAEFDDSA